MVSSRLANWATVVRLPLGLNLPRLAFALTLSLILYFFAVTDTNQDVTRDLGFTIPVQVVNTPAGLVVTDQPPQIHLQVEAPVNVLDRLQAASFVAQVDASTAVAGENDLVVNVRSIDTGVTAVYPQPATVQLEVEEIQQRTIPVQVNLTGQVPSGYQLGSPVSDPTQVTVSGAASVVSQAVEALVPVAVNGVTVSVTGAYTPSAVDANGSPIKGLTMTPPAVNVSVPITQQTQYKEVGVRPTITGTPANGYVIAGVAVNPPTVTLVGDPSGLGNVDYVVTASVDVTNLSSTVVRQVAVTAPAQTLLLQSGQTVQVTVQVAPLTLTQTIRATPSVINPGAGLVVTRPPSPVNVTITGPAPTLSSLTPNDFQVVVDAQGDGPGTYTLQPTVENLPTGMQVTSIDPATVTVILGAAPTPAGGPSPAPGSP